MSFQNDDLDTSAHLLGRWGEGVASEFLLELGFELVSRNVRVTAGEIDLIMKKENRIHFVEVRTRASQDHTQPLHSVDAKKMKKFRRAVEIWLLQNKIWQNHLPYLSLLTVVERSSQPPLIEWFPDLWDEE